MKPIRPRLALLTAAALSSAAAFAQTAPKSNAAAGEAVQLSSFVVQTDQDKGYAAMNSTGATRINMAIIDVPVNISVITREFLDDSLAFDFQDALAYSPGVITRRDDRTAIVVRGFGVGEPFVNNFRRIDYQDSSNMERVEVIRGAAAVLYGVTSAGGTVNVITKKAVYGKTFGELKATYGSYDFRRAQIDYNVPAGDKLAFRLTAAHQHSSGYRSPDVERDYHEQEINVLTPTVSFRPFKGTNLTVEYEHQHADKGTPEGIITQNVGGRNVPVAILYGYPIGKAFKGPYTVDNVHNRALTAILDQRLTDDLSLRLSAYQVDYKWPRGGLGAFSFAQPNGTPWLDPVTNAPSWRARWAESLDQWNKIYSYRADAVWKIDVGPTKHQFLAGGQYYEDTNASRTQQDFLPGTRTTRMLYYPLSDKNVVAQRPRDLNYQPLNSGTRNRDENSQVYAVHTGKFFDEKLITLAGLFRIGFDNINRPANPADNTRDPSVHAFAPATKFQNKTSAPQFGVLYKPTGNYSLYALYSESVSPVETGRNDQFGNPLNPTFAESYELGAKVDLTKKLIGTVGLYRAEIQNSNTFNERLPNPFNPTADPNISPRGAYEQVGKRLVTGLVADLVWAPTRQFEARVGWQHIFKNEITDDTNKAIIGQKHGRHIRDFVTFFGRYTFAESGPLAGWAANLGLEWRGKQHREYAPFAGNQATYLQGYWSSDAALRYAKRIGSRTYTFALNGKNLLRREAPIGYQPNTVEPYYFRTDREFYLSVATKL